MFKVMCIRKDTRETDSHKPVIISLLIEGSIYTVEDVIENHYLLLEFPGTLKLRWTFNSKNFIPLSEIDEIEMERNYQIKTITI